MIVGKFDGYDFATKTLIDIKTVDDANIERLPRKKDIDQLQYFWSLINATLPVMMIEKLLIFYCDRQGNYTIENVDKVNRLEEMKKRIEILHKSLKKRIAPEETLSYICKYCPFQQKCNLEYRGYRKIITQANRL